jgi:hypothetical protein
LVFDFFFFLAFLQESVQSDFVDLLFRLWIIFLDQLLNFRHVYLCYWLSRLHQLQQLVRKLTYLLLYCLHTFRIAHLVFNPVCLRNYKVKVTRKFGLDCVYLTTIQLGHNEYLHTLFLFFDFVFFFYVFFPSV